MTELPRRAVRRSLRLAALPLGYVGRTALGLTPAEVQQRTAEQLFRTLGELKGGAMKFGQAMSIFESALPDAMVAPYREQLTRLQDSAPPMPTITIRQRLAEELGPDWGERLVDFDPEPTAAASIGQVHRGHWRSSAAPDAQLREVAVKVQYPGADQALLSDLRQLARVARSLGPLLPGIDVKPLVAELQERAAEELDYRLEAESQRAFAASYAGDEHVIVPDVVAHSRRVLVTDWLESSGSLAAVIRDGDQAERDRVGGLFARFLFGSPARVGLLHADPHPGNFRVCGDRLGVLDFGAVARLPDRSLPESLGQMLRIAGQEDYSVVVENFREQGFIRPGVHVDPERLRAYLGPLIEPTLTETFTFSRAWMQEQFQRIQDPGGDAYGVVLRLNLPPEYLLIHRTWTGAIGVLSQLEATVPFRALMEESVPGFA